MDILSELEDFINEFNKREDENFSIDSIRIEFNKKYKLESLKELGSWKKLNKNNQTILAKLKKKFLTIDITNVYQLENYNIYYYNKKDSSKINNKY